ncbi:MAG: pilus assembly FimT family protein [Thermodesulfobacteriota bacterium]
MPSIFQLAPARPVRNRQAFTLIELIVVISLIGTMLFFAVPRIEQSMFANKTKKVSRWILLNVNSLKDKAVQKQVRHVLHADIDSNRFWISHAAMPEDLLADAREKGFSLPDGFRLIDVAFPDDKKVSGGTAAINFYPKGYSDRAIVHLADDNNRRRSYLIESFLPRAKIKHEYVEFQE